MPLRISASAQPSSVFRRPTHGLLREILSAGEFLPVEVGTLLQPLLDHRLVEIVNLGAPRAEWTLAVPASIWAALRGDEASEPEPGLMFQSAADCEPLEKLVLPAGLAVKVSKLAPLLCSGAGGPRLIVIRGLPGSDRAGLAAGLARFCGRNILRADNLQGVADPRLLRLGALATLRNAAPVVTAELSPGESLHFATLPGASAPLMVLLGFDGGVSGQLAESAVNRRQLSGGQDRPAMLLPLGWSIDQRDHVFADESALPVGVKVMTNLALDYLFGGK